MARILIVEDEQRIASFVSKGLRADGHHTTTVADGREGLDHALSGDYDLVVLDIGLPSMDGFEVLDQLRSQGAHRRVFVRVVVRRHNQNAADTEPPASIRQRLAVVAGRAADDAAADGVQGNSGAPIGFGQPGMDARNVDARSVVVELIFTVLPLHVPKARRQ